MNGKRCKVLRKRAGFIPAETRKYTTGPASSMPTLDAQGKRTFFVITGTIRLAAGQPRAAYQASKH